MFSCVKLHSNTNFQELSLDEVHAGLQALVKCIHVCRVLRTGLCDLYGVLNLQYRDSTPGEPAGELQGARSPQNWVQDCVGVPILTL